MGWVEDVEALYRQTTVFVRLTHHDGTAFTVLEAESRARHVIWTYDRPGVITARGHDAVKAALADLYARHQAGTLEPNAEGRDYALGHFNFQALATELDTRLQTLLGENRPKNP